MNASTPATGAETVIPIPNGDFSAGLENWTLSRGDCGLDRGPDGGPVLRIRGDETTDGAKVESALVDCPGPGVVELRGRFRSVRGRHLGLWIREYDAAGNLLPCSQNNFGQVAHRYDDWRPLVRQVILDEQTTHLQLFLLAYRPEDEEVEAYIDEVHFVRLDLPIPPLPRQYKLQPGDTERLTAADVVGPDGRVYPDWTRAGVQGGIPEVPAVADLADYGGEPETDIAEALDRACRELGPRGGGALTLGPGRYYLDRPVTIHADGVVLRGAGRDATEIVFRYGFAERNMGFYWPEPGGTVGPDTQVELHAHTAGLVGIDLWCGESQVTSERLAGQWQFATRVAGRDLLDLRGPGEVDLRAVARYDDGQTRESVRRVVLTEDNPATLRGADPSAALYFRGAGIEPVEHHLTADGKRGDTVLRFAADHPLVVGERIGLHAPKTETWRALVRDRCPSDWVRFCAYEIVAVDGPAVTINQPLRIDYPAGGVTYARRLTPIRQCGVEDLALRHLHDLPIDTVRFQWAWNCWARGVAVHDSGSNGVYALQSKHIEVRDCLLDGTRNWDGGQGYAGFTRSWDCLWTDTFVRGYRHGPVVQFGAQGNVFRDSVFEDSDLQWHAGWCVENLFENCVVHSRPTHGSYGCGAYATGSNDLSHGPNGPRNVVYNCDFTAARRGGAILAGINEHWLFLHNRFDVQEGPGFLAYCGAFDHVLANNVFILRDPAAPMLKLRTVDCVGYEVRDNRLYGGNGVLYEGPAPLAVEENNSAQPLPATGLPPRPEANPASIHRWQVENASAKGR